MKRVNILLVCTWLLMLFCLFGCGDVAVAGGAEDSGSESEAAEPFDISAFSVSIGGERIFLSENEGVYTLYLPSAYEDACWTADVTVNGERVTAGESAVALFSADEVDICGVRVRVMRSGALPALFLISDDGSFEAIDSSPDHSYGTGGSYSLISESGDLLSAGRLKKIRGRGNSTWNGTEKKPYQIELTSNKSLLGLAEAKKYLLLANYYDPSLLRNSFALDLASRFDGYSPGAVPIDLYASGEYLGSYLLCEKIDIHSEKIDIFDLEKQNKDLLSADPEDYERGGELEGAPRNSGKWFELPLGEGDVSGGYILEVDYPERYPDEKCGFVTTKGLPIVIVSPEEASREQVEYIKSYVCAFEDALYSESGYSDEGKHYSEYADVDSLVFRYLFEEFMLNIDGGISSFHIYKDSEERGGKLNFSCVWDYDCALGNYNKFADLTSPKTLFVASSETRNNGSMPSWFHALVSRPEMKDRISEYYCETFRDNVIVSFEGLSSIAATLRPSALMDLDKYAHSELRNFYGAESGEDFDSAYKYLCKFIAARIGFFGETFG